MDFAEQNLRRGQNPRAGSNPLPVSSHWSLVCHLSDVNAKLIFVLGAMGLQNKAELEMRPKAVSSTKEYMGGIFICIVP